MVKVDPHTKEWRLVKYQVETLIASEKDRLTSAKTWEEAKESQGKIMAWRTVLMMEDVDTDAHE